FWHDAALLPLPTIRQQFQQHHHRTSPVMPTFELKAAPKRTDSDVQHIVKGLNEFNRSVTGSKMEPLVITARDDSSEIIAGVLGGTWEGWLVVDALWVDEHHRHRGCGTHLLEMAESEAVRRGCTNA